MSRCAVVSFALGRPAGSVDMHVGCFQHVKTLRIASRHKGSSRQPTLRSSPSTAGGAAAADQTLKTKSLMGFGNLRGIKEGRARPGTSVLRLTQQAAGPERRPGSVLDKQSNINPLAAHISASKSRICRWHTAC